MSSKFKLRRVKVEGRVLLEMHGTPVLCVCVCSVAHSCLTLHALMGRSPPGSCACGIFHARILGWVTMPSSRDLPIPGIEPMTLVSPALADRFFPLVAQGVKNLPAMQELQ